MVKNAIAYVSRKKSRTRIVLIILAVVLTFLYACTSILKQSDNLEKTLYENSTSKIYITRKGNNGYFNKKDLEKLNSLKEVKEIISEYEYIGKLKDLKVIETNQAIKRDDIPDEYKNVLNVLSTNNVEKTTLFNSGIFTIKEGRMIKKTDRNKVLIHEELAKINNLKLKDKIKIKSIDQDKGIEYEIVGIFNGKKQEKYTGLSSDFSENSIFTDYNSVAKDLKTDTVTKLTVVANDKNKIKELSKKIEQLDVNNDFNIETDNNAYKETLESISSVKYIIKIMSYLIIIGGIVVLSLILILWLRERIYEIGVLLSIGITKLEIITQFILELVMISAPAAIISLLLGNLVVNEAISKIVATESIASGNILPTSISTNILVFTESYLILILVILLSVLFASSMILIKKPKEILSKIS